MINKKWVANNPDKKGKGGVKFDEEKTKLHLVRPEFIMELGGVLTYGANKYGDYNWMEGLDYSRSIAAYKRHLNAFEQKEDFDDETGLSHLAHAAANLMFLFHFRNRKDLDDRK